SWAGGAPFLAASPALWFWALWLDRAPDLAAVAMATARPDPQPSTIVLVVHPLQVGVQDANCNDRIGEYLGPRLQMPGDGLGTCSQGHVGVDLAVHDVAVHSHQVAGRVALLGEDILGGKVTIADLMHAVTAQ